MEKMTQHQLGQIKQKLSKLSQKFELVAAGFILRFTFHYPLEAGENFVQ